MSVELSSRTIYEVTVPNHLFNDTDTLINVREWLTARSKTTNPVVWYIETRGNVREIDLFARANMNGVIRFFARVSVDNE